MATEFRAKLAPYFRKRMKFRGVFDRIDIWLEKDKDVRRACIRSLEIGDEIVADHAWVIGAQQWDQHKHRIGETVEFRAVVDQYADDRVKEKINYCLKLADPPQFDHLPVMKIPDPVGQPSYRLNKEVATAPTALAVPVQTGEVLAGSLQVLRVIRRFARVCGGEQAALALLLSLQEAHLDLAQVIEWLRVLKEE